MTAARGRQVDGPASAAPAHRPGRVIGIAVALVGMILVAFAPALWCGFVSFDDPIVLLDNPHIRTLDGESLRWMFTQTRVGHYHPLTWLTYAVEHALWGFEPAGYHAVNLFLHAANAVLFLVLARRLLALSWKCELQERADLIDFTAGGAAALFAVHPLRVESVVWITERRDVLSVFLLLAAAIAYVRYAETGERGRGWRMYLVSVLLLALSLLSKAWGMSFFVVALILDWYPLRRFVWAGWSATSARRAGTLILEKWPFIVLGVAAAAMAAHAQNTAVATKTLEQWGVLERAAQSVYGLGWYAQKSLWPSDLSVLYELPWVFEPFSTRFVTGYAAALALGAGVLLLGRRYRGVLAAALVYAVMLAPVLGVLQSGDQLVADRYSYLACMGWAMVVAAGFALLWTGWSARAERRRLALAASAAGVVLLALVVRTNAQSRVWENGVTLWGHASRVTPTPMVLTNYAIALGEIGRGQEGVPLLERAVELNPRDGRAWFMLGNLNRDAGRLDTAEEAYIQATIHQPQAFMAHVNLGALYLKQLGRPADALASFRAAVADVERGGRRPLSAMPYLALGDALRRTGDASGAAAAFRLALGFEETRSMAEAELKRLGAAP